jgi:WhiB family redox-sensing transcriptional regulator
MTTLVEFTKNWQEKAACKGVNLDIFITNGDADDEPTYPPREATAYCDRCPVLNQCLTWATETKAIGIWGRTTSYQRRQLARHRERLSCLGCGSQDLVIVNGGLVEVCLACGISWHVL